MRRVSGRAATTDLKSLTAALEFFEGRNLDLPHAFAGNKQRTASSMA